MHTIERLIDGTRDLNKSVSEIIDMREHVSMSLHVGFLGGSTAVLYGTIIEPKQYNNATWIPVSLNGSTTISANGVYIVPPQFRYYKLVLNRAPGAVPTILFYAVKHGAWIVRLADDVAIADGEMDKIRKLPQKDLLIQSTALTNSPVTLASFSYTATQVVYILSSSFSLTKQGGAEVKVKNTTSLGSTVLMQYTLSGEQPNVIEQIPFLYKLDHSALAGTLSIEATKLIHNWDTNLFGRLTYIIN